MKPVSSSNLAAVDYSPLTATLEVKFHSGRIYVYSHVPWDVYIGLMQAESHGSFFYWNIRTSYRYRRLR